MEKFTYYFTKTLMEFLGALVFPFDNLVCQSNKNCSSFVIDLILEPSSSRLFIHFFHCFKYFQHFDSKLLVTKIAVWPL